MRDLLFGAVYYPEYMPYDRIKKDLEMMKRAGMNTLRIAESTWSSLEPEDGRFDFSYIDRVLEAAKEEGMSVIIGTPTYALPSWLAKKEPEILVERKDGRAFYGARQLMDIVHPVYRFHAGRMIHKLAEHTAKHEAVIGFQIDNETKHYGNYGKYAQELFVDYLKDRFVTTEALNQAFSLNFWSNAIHSWEDFPDMRGCCNAGLGSCYEVFLRHLAAEFLKWQAGLVVEFKREDQFITHNFDFEWKKFGADIAQDGYSYGVQPDINHAEASAAVTLAGTDIYHPTQDALTGAEIAFGGDEIRCLKQENYLVLETQGQGFKNWTPYPGQLKLHAYSHLASGAAGLLYWNWHSIHTGYEAYWLGLLGHDLEENEAYREACLIGEEWQRLENHLSRLKKENKVAVVVDDVSLDALKWYPTDKDLSYNDMVRWVYDSLYELNIECDVIDINMLVPERYRMIVTPALYSVSEETVQALEQFVRQGGVLVSTFRSFVADRNLSIYPDRKPYGLNECFGMMYQQFTEPGRMTVEGKSARYFAELLQPKEAETLASYEHKYWGRYSAVTRNRYGEGSAYYVGTYLSKEQLKKYLLSAAADGEIAIPAQRWPVIIKSGTADGKKLHYILHYSEDCREIDCPCEEAEELFTGRIYRRGEKILLKDWDVKILEECERPDDVLKSI